LTVNGDLRKLVISELDKYLLYHDLPKTEKKIKRIICHVCRSRTKEVQAVVTACQQEQMHTESEYASESDIVLFSWGDPEM